MAKFKLDTRRLGSPGDYVEGVWNWLTDIELKVVGAREENGRLTTLDLDGGLFHYFGALDFTQPLLEQPCFLDFNLFGRHGCPEGSYEQELTLQGDLGKRLTLTRLVVVASGILERK